MSPFRALTRLARSLRRPLAYLLAMVLPPFLVVAASAVTIGAGPALPGRAAEQLRPPTFEGALPAPSAHDPARPTALILAGNTATESSDLLGPYAVLAASGRFNVDVVAPERTLTPLIPVPLCCGPLDLLPHYSFAEYAREIGVTPDLVVVPYIPFASGQDAAVLTWLRERPGDQTVILSICGGSQVVADAGLLAGRRATSHHTIQPLLETAHPEVSWVQGLRYVEDGRFISSAGVTSGIDASLHTLRRFFGREAADETARRLGYPHTRFLDDPTWQFASVKSAENTAAILPNAFRWNRTQIGLVLYDGVGEIELSSVVDTYPRSTSTDVLAIAPARRYVRTAHGLDLLPRFDLATAPALDRVLIPGQPAPALDAELDRWAAARGLATERIHAAGAYPYDVTFQDLARTETRPIAGYAAAWLEYPTAQLDLGSRAWDPALVLRAAGLSLLGLLAALGFDRARRQRRPDTALRAEPARA